MSADGCTINVTFHPAYGFATRTFVGTILPETKGRFGRSRAPVAVAVTVALELASDRTVCERRENLGELGWGIGVFFVRLAGLGAPTTRQLTASSFWANGNYGESKFWHVRRLVYTSPLATKWMRGASGIVRVINL